MSDIVLPDTPLRVNTHRFGRFTFRVGVDTGEINLLYQRVVDAFDRFRRSPLSQVAGGLEREVVVSSIFGTNTIEGGRLTEEETAAVVDLPPALVQAVEQRRAANLKLAYELAAREAPQAGWQLSVDYIRQLHALITQQLPDTYNQPGQYRDNPDGVVTWVGNAEHGGRYKPPQVQADIVQLITGMVAWHAALVGEGVPALIRAPLIHYYYELVHPFWDGNGRVGRVLEASILMHAGAQYAPFAQARYYLEHIHQYFALFSECRKAAEKDLPHPNTAFVQFYLRGMLSTVNRLHDRVDRLVEASLFQNTLGERLADKTINQRQYAIARFVLEAREPISLQTLRKQPWYIAMYARLADKTRQRDLTGLQVAGLVRLDAQKQLRPGVMREQSG